MLQIKESGIGGSGSPWLPTEAHRVEKLRGRKDPAWRVRQGRRNPPALGNRKDFPPHLVIEYLLLLTCEEKAAFTYALCTRRAPNVWEQSAF